MEREIGGITAISIENTTGTMKTAAILIGIVAVPIGIAAVPMGIVAVTMRIVTFPTGIAAFLIEIMTFLIAITAWPFGNQEDDWICSGGDRCCGNSNRNSNGAN